MFQDPFCLLRRLVAGLLVSSAMILPLQAQTPPTERATTLLAERDLQLWIGGLPADCAVLKISLQRDDALLPGYAAFARLVRPDAARGRGVQLTLGPEFWPAIYAPGSVRWSCLNAAGQSGPVQANREALHLQSPSVALQPDQFEKVSGDAR
ncbi:MAG: hypothetical protein ACO1RX_22040 [Candidatus Sericytochromatia bacterium]